MRRPGARFNRRTIAWKVIAAEDPGGDVTAPELVSAVIPSDGLSLILTYDENLNESSVPAAGDFTLSGTSAEPDSVDVSGDTVTITLDAAVPIGAVVTFDYTAGANPIEDLAENAAANLDDEPVTNNSTVDVTAPTLSSVVVDSSGTFIDFTFNENMDQTSTPAAGDMDFDGTTQATIASFAWQSATVLRATLATYRAMGSSFETILIDYVVGASPIRDLAGNNKTAFSNQAVTNNSIHAPELVVETLFSGTSWTSPTNLYGTSIVVEGWGPGQGGNTNTKAGDAGYYCLKTDTIAANTAYAYAIGAVGAVGGGAGGDVTWRTNVLIAPGGASATSPVGDTTRAGAAGGTGAGTQTGGGSPGSTSAASGGTAGEPNGAPGTNGNNVSRTPGTGGVSTTTQQRAGAPGLIRLSYSKAPPFTGQYITAVAEYRDTAGSTTRNLAAPGTHQSGDIIIVLSSTAGASTPASSQATEIIETANSTLVTGAMYARTADGTDTITLTSTSVAGAYLVARVRGSNGIANVEASSATGTGSAPNAGTHTPTGGSAERLVFTFCAINANSSNQNSISSIPTNYYGILTPQRGNSSGMSGLCWGVRRETASSYTPGAFGSNIENWVAITGSVE